MTMGVDDNGWTCTDLVLRVPLGGRRHTGPHSQKGSRGVDNWLAETDPPS
jgi:hypothetical protein